MLMIPPVQLTLEQYTYPDALPFTSASAVPTDVLSSFFVRILIIAPSSGDISSIYHSEIMTRCVLDRGAGAKNPLGIMLLSTGKTRHWLLR